MRQCRLCIWLFPALALLFFGLPAYTQELELEIVISLIKVESQDMRVYETNEKERINKFFEDDKIKISWKLSDKLDAFFFALVNKTDRIMTINWDSATFVDESAVNHRIVHSGIKYADRDRSQPSTIILSKSIHEDLIIPSDYIYWNTVLRGSWNTRMLFCALRGEVFGGKYHASYGETLEEIIRNLGYYEGKEFRVLLPLFLNERMIGYVFTFGIYRARLTNRILKGRISRKEWSVVDLFFWVIPGKSNREQIILKWGKPASGDEDSIIYTSDQHHDFRDYRSVKFIFNTTGVVNQIRVER